MPNGPAITDQQLLEMRWRCLSLAADLDRVERAGGPPLLGGDPRLQTLARAIQQLLQPGADRAVRVQMLFSDQTPAPSQSKR